jgi:hypothetical protein
VTIVSGAEPVTWLRVHEPVEAVTRRIGRPDGTVLAIGSAFRRAHATGLTDIAASTLAHRLVDHLLDRYAGLPEPDRRARAGYTSLFGGAPERLAAGTLVTRWQGLLPGFDGTQHLLGPLVITPTGDDDATVACNVRGYHHLNGSTWLVAGRYSLTLRRAGENWRVAGIVLRTTYEEGDRSLAEQATARAAGPGA